MVVSMVVVLSLSQITASHCNLFKKDQSAMTAARLQRCALSDAARHHIDVEVDAFHVEQIEQLPVTATESRMAT